MIAACETSAPASPTAEPGRSCSGSKSRSSRQTFGVHLSDFHAAYMDVLVRRRDLSVRRGGIRGARVRCTRAPSFRGCAQARRPARDDPQAPVRRRARALRMSALLLRPGLPAAFRSCSACRTATIPRSRWWRGCSASSRRLDLQLAVDRRQHGSSRKVSNLINMMPLASHDYLVMSDSDVRVRARLSVEGRDPAARSRRGHRHLPLPRQCRAAGLWSLLGSMFINDWFIPSVRVAALSGSRAFAFGVTIAIRRQVLARHRRVRGDREPARGRLPPGRADAPAAACARCSPTWWWRPASMSAASASSCVTSFAGCAPSARSDRSDIGSPSSPSACRSPCSASLLAARRPARARAARA